MTYARKHIAAAWGWTAVLVVNGAWSVWRLVHAGTTAGVATWACACAVFGLVATSYHHGWLRGYGSRQAAGTTPTKERR